MPAAAIDAALEMLRARGERVTTPRRELVRALVDAPGHPSAEDLVQRLERSGADIHRATVYRTLDFLVRAGVVAHVHLPHGPATYHLVDADHHSHAHLACRGCERIFDVPDLLDAPAALVRDEFGFELDLDHVALTGWCRECRAAPSTK